MAEYMKSPDREWLKKRLIYAASCMMIAFSFLLARLVYLQVVEGQRYRRLSENNCIRLRSIKASRGIIYDNKGELLVDNRPSFNLQIVLKDAKPVTETIKKLSVLVNIPYDSLMSKIHNSTRIPKFKPYLLKKDISRDMLAIIEAHSFDLPGIIISVEPRRNYIFKNSCAHLLGYLGEINEDELKSGRYPGVTGGDSIGRYGVEKTFEKILRGKRGGQQIEVNANGSLVSVLKTVEPVPGRNIFLTLDYQLQKKAEAMLNGKAGAIVALDPNNGDVLVMASAPSFDPNDFIDGISSAKWKILRNDKGKPMMNKAIQGEYPPASTFKIVTAIAGLEEGVITRTTTQFCPGYYKFGNRVYRCWKKWGHGTLNVTGALEQSCDVFFYHTGEQLGVDAIAQYARGCGLGRLTGIKLDHERPGLVPTSSWKKKRFGVPWQGGETLSVAIGQGFDLVTPLQMAVLIAAIGNGGTLFRPRILKYVETPDGKIAMKQEPEITGGIPAGPGTLKIVRQGLLNVIQGKKGTARRIRIPGIEMAGKTGTAQVFNLKKKDREKNKKLDYLLRDHAWFICYAPAENPVIAVSVLVEHGEHGSSAAAPIAREIVKTYLEEKGIL